jgi:hypothetical protein
MNDLPRYAGTAGSHRSHIMKRCRHDWTHLGRSWRALRLPPLIVVSTSFEGLTERSDSRSSDATRRTWVAGLRSRITQVGSSPTRPRQSPLPETPSLGFLRCSTVQPEPAARCPRPPVIHVIHLLG